MELKLRTHWGFECVLLGLRRAMDLVVHHALSLAEDEPYGVRGATIFLRIDEDEDKPKASGAAAGGQHPAVEGKSLGAIIVDVATVSTFNLVLVLREERPFSVALKNWLGQLTGGKTTKVVSESRMWPPCTEPPMMTMTQCVPTFIFRSAPTSGCPRRSCTAAPAGPP